ncbi:MAG: hypothetical protein V1736_09810 [Pseudomonadota bacterium]
MNISLNSILSRISLRFFSIVSVAIVLFGLTPLLRNECHAGIEVRIIDQNSSGASFAANVNRFLKSIEGSSNEHLKAIVRAARNSPTKIMVSPITDDRSTWHKDGDRTRSHTEPLDGKPKKLGRSASTPCVIYMSPSRLDPNDRSYGQGTFAHELVHAIDLAYGRYHTDVELRERRAVFVQNLWRNANGYRLRDSYHGGFATLDYQCAKEQDKVSQFIGHILCRPDIPSSEPN